MATSNQMFGRVVEFLEGRYPNQQVNLQLLHGHAALSAELELLKMKSDHKAFDVQSVCADDDRQKSYDGAAAAVVAAEWFTYRKRGLLAPFGVGTVDQALMAVLQTRHVCVRLFGLAHKTVIIDEVHAYDAYMSTLLGRMLEWLRALGCSVVLLSATLPKAKRKALLRAYGGESLPEPPDGQYPCVSWVSAGKPVEPPRTFGTSEQSPKELRVSWHDDDLAQLGVGLRETSAEGGCAAVICNTVAQAQEVCLALKPFLPGDADDGLPQLDLFHARYPFEERAAREKRALGRFGQADDPNVKRPRTAVLVATQSFAVGGLVTHLRNEDPKLYKSADSAPLVKGAVALVRGENLFQTLMLNFHHDNGRDAVRVRPVARPPCLGTQ